jgi:hypothetical protein
MHDLHALEQVMHTVKAVIASTAFSLWAFAAGAVTVTPADAMGQVGHVAKVCGIVASTVYEASAPARPTFVTLISPDQPDANRALTAVIYGTDRAKFGGTPEAALEGQRICVIGFVSFFRQRPEMILSSPVQFFSYAPASVAALR